MKTKFERFKADLVRLLKRYGLDQGQCETSIYEVGDGYLQAYAEVEGLEVYVSIFAKRTDHLSFERRIMSRVPLHDGWEQVNLECGHIVQRLIPAARGPAVYCGQCLTDFIARSKLCTTTPI